LFNIDTLKEILDLGDKLPNPMMDKNVKTIDTSSMIDLAKK
jgi:hypothetical protein